MRVKKRGGKHPSLCNALGCLLGLMTGVAIDHALAEPPKTHTNSIGMEFVLIPAGEFVMGSYQGMDEDTSGMNSPGIK